MRFTIILLLFTFVFTNCKNDKPKSPNKKVAPPTAYSADKKNEEQKEEFISATDYFIKKYQGKIDDQYAIEMLLYHWGNGMLDGYYFYKKENGNGEKIELTGELNLDQSFVLNEYAKDKLTGKFHGKLLDIDKFEGTWSNADSSKSMSYVLNEIISKDEKHLEGTWHRNDPHAPGTLFIGNVSDKTFDFGLEIFSGGHNGLLSGTAEIEGKKATYYQKLYESGNPCILEFQFEKEFIIIGQNSENWDCEFGMRANASGVYNDDYEDKSATLLVDGQNGIFMNDEQHEAFEKLVSKEEYEDFAYNMQIVQRIKEHPEDQLGATVSTGSVAGLNTYNEAIIMINLENQIWAATIVSDPNSEGFLLKYFTNDAKMKNKLPKTIETWREKLAAHKVVF